MLWTVLALGFLQACSANPVHVSKRWDASTLVEKHSWAAIPQGWEFHSYPTPDHPFEIRIGLKQNRFDELVKALYEVSNPSHSKYGQHLSKAEVDVLVAPHADSVEAVTSWLDHHGVSESDMSRSTAGEWITVKLPVSQAERMLGAKYGVYHHPQSSDYVIRTLSYSLPKELHSHIDVVAPTTYFGTMRSMKATSFIEEDIEAVGDAAAKGAVKNVADDTLAPIPSACATRITPDCLQALYNTTGYEPSETDVNSLGIAGYLNEFANRADLQTFFQQFLPAAVGTTFETVLVNNGGDDQNDPGVEANLDIQYTEAMSWPTPNIYYSTGGSPPFIPDSDTPTNTNEPYLDWLNFVLAQDNIPQTFTTSYGENEQTVPNDYAVSVCNLFAQLGARGSSIMFSSGDAGVGGADCRTNDGTETVLFQPAFPAGCPFVTAVGGTTGINPEVAVSFSGGGFSRYFGVPDYQAETVASFVESLGDTYDGLFNKAGRAYPDVAAQGSRFQVVVGRQIVSVGGTSASSPTVAGVVALLNDFRISQGKPSLGFLNPLIYANPNAFNDITSGNNPGCNTDGFSAVEGWDPVTGMGTPDFVKLQAVV